PNIVAIHEIGEHNGQHYFSMDYVEGKHLAELTGSQPMQAQRAAGYVKTIAEAIHFAHQRGTLHRDLKPQNVIIDRADRPRITDFGLAKQTQRESSLTQTGVVMGSPSYMPPEQATGRHDQVGPHSDVYSLGAILYELLTGRPPFLAETAMATMMKVVEQEPDSPRKLNPDVPPDLETICLKCLEKRPERRYPSARALAEELDRFLKHEPILARPASALRKAVSWSRRHRNVMTAVVSAVILLLVGLAYGLWQQTLYLSWLNAHPGSPKVAGPRTAWLDQYDVLYVFGWLLAMVLRASYGKISRGVAFRNWLEPVRAYDPLRPITPVAVMTFGGAAVVSLAAALCLTALLIAASVWEGYAVESDLLFVFLLFYEGALLMGRLIREQASATFGVAPEAEQADLTPEQLTRIRNELYAGCRYDSTTLVKLYREFTGVRSRDAVRQLEQLAAKLFREHPEKFAVAPTQMHWAKVVRVILVLVGVVFLVPLTQFFLPEDMWPTWHVVFIVGLISGTVLKLATRTNVKRQLIAVAVVVVAGGVMRAVCSGMNYWPLPWFLGLGVGFVLVRLSDKRATGKQPQAGPGGTRR
ncbi:MAG: serine/threonine-protein kinase, partial [Verrucomicrobia bacterium]|nr:serine/threonine-protein kinase [Verrucomicrobiota bacterium]